MQTPSPTINQLHAEYARMIGDPAFPNNLWRVLAWDSWLGRGYTLSDLRLVVEHIQRGIKTGKRNEGALRFRRLIEDMGNFDEELAMARAETRNQRPPPDPKASVVRALPTLAQTITKAETEAAKPVGEIANEWVKGLAKMREAAR